MIDIRRVFRYWSNEESPSQARKAVRNAVLAWECGEEVAEIAELLTSELATNAVLHASDSREYLVEMHVAGGFLAVGVIDYGRGVPRVAQVKSGDTHGRGLAMVNKLAHTWGVESLRGGGKKVYFHLPVPELPPTVYRREALHGQPAPSRGTTPGLRVPLKRESSDSFTLTFGAPGQERRERLTVAQLMTLITDAAQEVELSVSAPQSAARRRKR